MSGSPESMAFTPVGPEVAGPTLPPTEFFSNQVGAIAAHPALPAVAGAALGIFAITYFARKALENVGLVSKTKSIV